MNEGQNTQAQAGLQRTALQAGSAQVSPQTPAGTINSFVMALQKHNARLNELILMQRDHCLKVTGNNPVDDEAVPERAVEPVGSLAELYAGLEWYEDLLKKLNNTTDAWLSL